MAKKYSKKEITENFVQKNNLKNNKNYFSTIWSNIRSDDSNFRITDEGYKLLRSADLEFYKIPLNTKLTLKSITKISKFVNCPFYLDLGNNKIFIVDQELAIQLNLLEDLNSFLNLQDSVDTNS